MPKRKTTTNKLTTVHKRVRRRVKLAIVPHADNQYRPHLIRTSGLTIMLVLIVALQFGYNLSKTGSVLGVEANVTSNQLLSDTNTERANNGVQHLQYNEQLSSAAYLKAQDMFARQYWAHNAPDGTTPWQWFAKVDYNYAYAGENLAKNFTTSSATIAAWMASPEHRKNMLDTHYSDIGLAVVDGTLHGKQTKLIVALFASPAKAVGTLGVTGQNVTPVGAMSPITQFGAALQSITPAALGSVVILLFAAVVALVAHAYRKQLPAPIRRSWRYHHGLYKAAGLSVLAVIIIALYSGGQI